MSKRMKNQRQANIKTSKRNFFKHWLSLTKPFHKLRQQEQDVLALLLYHYFEFKKDIKKDYLVWKMVFDYDTKMIMKEELGGMKDVIFQNVLSKLRKKNIIKDGKILDSYIPNIEPDAKTFSVIFKFILNDGV